MNKFFKALFVTFMLLVPLTANAECNIVIDSETLICRDSNGVPISPFVENGTTYVPVRSVADAFDTQVNWDQATLTVHLGEVGGTPVLGEHVNIYYNGEEFVCLDVNGTRVYPILRDSATYLPIRGIGNLFGKTIAWDDVKKTAILTTPPSADELNYLTDAIANTEMVEALPVFVEAEGTMSYNGSVISSSSNSVTEPYSPYGFTLSAFLPQDYQKGVSYLGEGKYFIAASSEKLNSDFSIQHILNKNNSTAMFSMLYITIDVKGGYITNISVSFGANVSYNTLLFNQDYSITAAPQYPEGFAFPNTPFPEGPRSENESFIPVQSGENTDSTQLLKKVDTFVTVALAADSAGMLKLISAKDHDVLFGKKSNAQYKSEISAMGKRLLSAYENATGSYNVEKLVYIDASLFPGSERAAKAVLSMEYLDSEVPYTENLELTFYMSNGSWYINPDIVADLIK